MVLREVVGKIVRREGQIDWNSIEVHDPGSQFDGKVYPISLSEPDHARPHSLPGTFARCVLKVHDGQIKAFDPIPVTPAASPVNDFSRVEGDSPVLVTDEDQAFLFWLQQRKGTEDDPTGRLCEVAQLRSQNCTVERIATLMQCSTRTVKHRLALLKHKRKRFDDLSR